MIPKGLTRKNNELGHFLAYDPARGFSEHKYGAVSSVAKIERSHRSLPILFGADACLVRTIKLPPVGDADLRKLVLLDADRIMPMPPAKLILAARSEGKVEQNGLVSVGVAGLPRDAAEAMMTQSKALGLAPARIGMMDLDNPDLPPFDFSAGFRDMGLIEKSSSAASAWWLIVAVLFALNVSILVWRDVESVNRLQTLVDQQAPAVNSARSLSRRIATAQGTAFQLAQRRRRQDGIQILAEVSSVLPPQAWVQRFSWQGDNVRITGYKRGDADVLGALRKSALFDKVRASNSEVIAEIQSGQPFDISFVVRNPA